MEIEINKAKQKSYAHLSVEEVEKFLLSKVFEDPDDIKVRKLLVNSFVREVIWYGDRMVITYNFQERFSTDRFSKSYVEDIERQVGESSRSPSSFPLSSYKVTQSAPWQRELTFVSSLFRCTVFERDLRVEARVRASGLRATC